jgi:hypothetical protein
MDDSVIFQPTRYIIKKDDPGHAGFISNTLLPDRTGGLIPTLQNKVADLKGSATSGFCARHAMKLIAHGAMISLIKTN